MPTSMAVRVFILVPYLLLLLLQCLYTSAAEPIFYESFEEDWVGRWHPSNKEGYQGFWKRAKIEGHENYGLLVSEKARKYGIATILPEAVEFKDKPVILQYELRLQNGIECGGSYLKFLRAQKDGWTPDQLDNTAPYSIMFGPDKCGSTNKVHFIFQHKNPKTGSYREHHLKFPPSPPNDKLSHVFTAFVYPNNTVSIFIDEIEKKTADLLSESFDPPVIPPKTIPDPEDKKPEDWDERVKIPDPEAVKPEDWDENAPYEIEDLDATKPVGWLDDEPEEIDDPDAIKPEDWDDDEDGEWEPPKVRNPKCEDGLGCGQWMRPKKKNPAYKGKWYAPMIDNPAYKGVWKARQIPNPEYFHMEKLNLEPVVALGIEIWTMQDGILFDNILITNDEKIASIYREQWKAKYDIEKEQQKKEEAEKAARENAFVRMQNKLFKFLYDMAELPSLAPQREMLLALIEIIEENQVAVLSVIGIIVVVALYFVFRLLLNRTKSKKSTFEGSLSKAKKEDISCDDDAEDSEGSEDKGKGKEKVFEENSLADEFVATRHRRPRRET